MPVDFMIFQSTSSIQRKTHKRSNGISGRVFQSTSSIQRKTPSGKHRGGCGGISIHFLYTQEDYALLEPIYFFCISIHFLYTEEDHSGQREWLRMDISIHFLYTEEDLRNTLWIIFIVLFQSTSSIQRKTFYGQT